MFYQIDRIRQSFADQFEQDGATLVFRKNLKGDPVEVTVAERDALLAQFNRRIAWLGALTIPLTIFAIVGIGVATFALETDFSEPLAFLAVAFILVPVLSAGAWVWNAPARLIAGRAPIGPGRSSSEMKKLGMAKLTWVKLAGTAALGVLLLLRVHWGRDLASASNLVWLCLSAFLVLVAAVQSIRKLRAERTTGLRPNDK